MPSFCISYIHYNLMGLNHLVCNMKAIQKQSTNQSVPSHPKHVSQAWGCPMSADIRYDMKWLTDHLSCGQISCMGAADELQQTASSTPKTLESLSIRHQSITFQSWPTKFSDIKVAIWFCKDFNTCWWIYLTPVTLPALLMNWSCHMYDIISYIKHRILWLLLYTNPC